MAAPVTAQKSAKRSAHETVHKAIFLVDAIARVPRLTHDSVTIAAQGRAAFIELIHLTQGHFDNAADRNLDHLHADVRLSGSDTRRTRIYKSSGLRDSQAFIRRASDQQFPAGLLEKISADCG